MLPVWLCLCHHGLTDSRDVFKSSKVVSLALRQLCVVALGPAIHVWKIIQVESRNTKQQQNVLKRNPFVGILQINVKTWRGASRFWRQFL